MGEINSGLWFSVIIALIGGLLGVIVTICYENYQRKKERIEQVKPIIINTTLTIAQNSGNLFLYDFEAKGSCSTTVTGFYKNSDNGILLFDFILTDNKSYFPIDGATVDKNSFFGINLCLENGETLKKLKIYCHDIYDNHYCYDGHFNFDTNKPIYSEIIVGEIKSISKRKYKKLLKNNSFGKED